MEIVKRTNGQSEIDLLAVAKLLLSKSIIILVVGLIFGIASALFTYLFIKPEYTASITMYVNNTNDVSEKYNITSSDISASIMLIQTYTTIIKSETVLEDIIEFSGVDYDMKQLSEMIQAGSVENTEVLVVYVTGENPKETALIADSIAEIVPNKLSEIVTGSSVKVLNSVQARTERTAPRYNIVVVLGVLLGICSASVYFVLISIFNTKIKSSADIKRWKYPLLITLSESTSKEKEDENFRDLATNVVYSIPGSLCKKILVASTASNENKTQTAFRLAGTLADTGYRVLFIEGDLQSQNFAEKYHAKETPGLSDVLVNISTIDHAIQHYTLNLDLLTGGTQVPNPEELLGSENMERLLNSLEEQYDFIIADCPPLWKDVVALAQYMTGIVYVVKCGYVRKEAIEDCLNKIKQSGAKMLGFVVWQKTMDNSQKRERTISYQKVIK